MLSFLAKCLIFSLLLKETTSYGVGFNRRILLKSVVSGVSAATLLVTEEAHASKYCAFGEGDGCEELAEGNELIRQLQARSAANKEAIQAVRAVF